MAKPSAAWGDGEHVAFHSARKGLGHMLLMRTSLVSLRGHLPPVLQLRKRSVQRGHPPGTLEKDGSHSSEARCRSGGPH